MKRHGGIETGLQAREKAQTALLKRLDQTFEGELVNLRPTALADFLFNPKDPSRATLLVEMLENAGSTEFARNMVEQLCEKATESLEVLGAGSVKDSLAEIADFVSRRSG